MKIEEKNDRTDLSKSASFILDARIFEKRYKRIQKWAFKMRDSAD
jgi:hypothetical protein